MLGGVVAPLMGLVIEKTEFAFLKSFPCIVVKKTFQVTCGVASSQIQKKKLILFCRVPASSRRQQISIILQFAPLTDVGWSRGSTCGFSYREDRSCISQVVPLHSCKKDISSRLRSCKFSDPEKKVDLIFSRAGVTADLDPPGPNPLADMDPPSQI